MMIEENTMFYTPKTKAELFMRVEELAIASNNPAAVYTAVMMMQNFIAVNYIAVETKAVDLMN